MKRSTNKNFRNLSSYDFLYFKFDRKNNILGQSMFIGLLAPDLALINTYISRLESQGATT